LHLVEFPAIHYFGVPVLNLRIQIIKAHFLSAAKQSISKLAIISMPSQLLIRRGTLSRYRRIRGVCYRWLQPVWSIRFQINFHFVVAERIASPFIRQLGFHSWLQAFRLQLILRFVLCFRAGNLVYDSLILLDLWGGLKCILPHEVALQS